MFDRVLNTPMYNPANIYSFKVKNKNTKKGKKMVKVK